MKKNLPLILLGTGIAILVGCIVIFKKQLVALTLNNMPKGKKKWPSGLEKEGSEPV